MHPAKASRLRKEQHPNLYCSDSRCLWTLSSGLCPRHTSGGNMRNTHYKDAAKRRQEWAEAARPPQTPDCKHEVLVIHNGVLCCTECNARSLV